MSFNMKHSEIMKILTPFRKYRYSDNGKTFKLEESKIAQSSPMELAIHGEHPNTFIYLSVDSLITIPKEKGPITTNKMNEIRNLFSKANRTFVRFYQHVLSDYINNVFDRVLAPSGTITPLIPFGYDREYSDQFVLEYYFAGKMLKEDWGKFNWEDFKKVLNKFFYILTTLEKALRKMFQPQAVNESIWTEEHEQKLAQKVKRGDIVLTYLKNYEYEYNGRTLKINNAYFTSWPKHTSEDISIDIQYIVTIITDTLGKANTQYLEEYQNDIETNLPINKASISFQRFFQHALQNFDNNIFGNKYKHHKFGFNESILGIHSMDADLLGNISEKDWENFPSEWPSVRKTLDKWFFILNTLTDKINEIRKKYNMEPVQPVPSN